MSGKNVRSIVAVALLALVMLVSIPVVAAPVLSQAGNSPATLAGEIGITKS